MKKQGRYRETNYGRSIKIITSALLIFIMLVAIVWGVVILKNLKTLPFRQVKISVDSTHIKMVELRKVVMMNLEGGFFSLKVYQLRQAFLALPWVADVSFRRVWPDQLMVNIEEQNAVARWGNQLINGKGQLFQPALSKIPKKLPLLEGPTGSLKEVLQLYHELSKALLASGVTISGLRLNSRHAWHMVLNGHIDVMLGRSDVEHRFKRFIALYPRIVGAHEKDIARVDLRYPNGLTIEWKPKNRKLTFE